MTESTDLRERLAALAHQQWSGWMTYLLTKVKEGPEGTLIVPAPLVARWRRQMETPYDQLPETEKDSDRVEADRMLAVLDDELLREAP